MQTHHIIHVKDDWFIGHGLNLSRKGQTSPPSSSDGRQDLRTPPQSPGSSSVDTRSRGHASAGGLEADHSVTAGQAKDRIRKRIRNQEDGHCRKRGTHVEQVQRGTTPTNRRRRKNNHLLYKGPSDVIQELRIFTQGDSEMRARAGSDDRACECGNPKRERGSV